MASQAVAATDVNEQALLSVVRTLPPERRAQVLDFARFLEAQTAAVVDLLDDETEEEIAASNERWDALLISDASQRLLEQMAAEALAEIEAGHARPMKFTNDGEIAPVGFGSEAMTRTNACLNTCNPCMKDGYE
jgi:hypothetical protein